MNSIELKNISKSFNDKRVLNNINLEVGKGEMISLFGASGCGKSTTLKLIAGIMTPDEGDILFNGDSIMKVPLENRGAVIVFQDHLLFPHMTVEDNIGFGLKMSGINRKERMKKVRELMELVELNGFGKRYPSEISGGQRQRAALARALAINPRVLLLDEPFSNLDQRLRENMRDFIYKLQRKLNITTILVTHDKEEALMMSSRVAVMDSGRIIQYAAPQEIYYKPSSKKAADLLGEKNYIRGRIEDNRFFCKLGSFYIKSEISGNILAMLKIEDISLNSHEGMDGVVLKARYAGDRTYYTVNIKDIELTCIGNSKKPYKEGERIFINLNFENAVFFKE